MILIFGILQFLGGDTVQVSGPLMVYGFCQGRTRFTTSHICNVYDFVESLSYELQPPTISFSTGNERTRFFLL